MVSISKRNMEAPKKNIVKSLTFEKISLHVQPGELVGVVGTIGSGKSSLLLSLLGEMEASSPNTGAVEIVDAPQVFDVGVVSVGRGWKNNVNDAGHVPQVFGIQVHA